MNRTLDTIGLCRRAGKLLYGFDSVTEEIKKPDGKASGVILARDLSEKTKKEARFVCEKYGVPICAPDISMDELEHIAGKRTGILAVLDEGLFASINSKSTKKPGDTE